MNNITRGVLVVGLTASALLNGGMAYNSIKAKSLPETQIEQREKYERNEIYCAAAAIPASLATIALAYLSRTNRRGNRGEEE